MESSTDSVRRRFDHLAKDRVFWREKNRYYYADQEMYFRFLIPEGQSVLELGCATGDLLAALSPSRGVGIDISPKMIERAREKYPALEFREGDIEDLEDLGETFDFIVMSDVIGHLQDIEETLRNVRRFCNSKSRLIISYYNFLWEPILKLGELVRLKMPQKHQNWLSAADIANLLSLADFDVVKTEYRMLIPKRIPYLSDFVNRYFAHLPGIRKVCLCCYLVARPINLTERKERSVSVVIPCRNEKGNIENAINRTPTFGRDQEFIFVDGHSTDGTADEIQRVIEAYPEKNITFLVQDGTGKGDAVRKGFANASGDILMILDADLTMPPEDLPKFYDAIVSGKGEFINGCRLVYPMEKQAMRLLNLFGNKFFSLAFTWLLNQRIKDTLCGTKVLFKEDYERLVANRHYFGEFDPFGDFDLLFGAAKLNLKIVEVPIRYRERTYGATNISRFRHGWLLLKMTIFAFKKIKAI
jgi:ubiquinone/menaquinone biosynthesis C-methylase UbiE